MNARSSQLEPEAEARLRLVARWMLATFGADADGVGVTLLRATMEQQRRMVDAVLPRRLLEEIERADLAKGGGRRGLAS